MLLSAVILILREVIEASLIISLFLAFSQLAGKPRISLAPALFLGFSGAVIYATNINTISQWADGVGQEIVNACIHLLIYTFLLIFVITATQHKSGRCQRLATSAMIAGIVLATTQEGSEIMLYLYGFSSTPDLLKPVLLGGLIGFGIGLSAGVFFYYFLINISRKNGITIGFIMILLIAGSMVLQGIQLLTQADWISAQYPLWDSSSIISEHSMMGQFLYALIGYEATPTAFQVFGYLSSLALILVLSAYFNFRKP